MVRETRHLWVGNLPDNIREDRIREHFKRYGRVQSVKLLPRGAKEEAGESAMACTVAFMDIKSASKAHNAEHKLDDRTLTTEYYEPAAIPSAASPQNTPSSYSTSPGSTRFPNGHGSTEEHANFGDRFYERPNNRVTEGEFIRRTNYHDNCRGRNRDRSYRNGPYNAIMDRSHRTLNNSWSAYDSTRYNSQNETGYVSTPSDSNERRSSDQSTKKKAKSRSGSRSPSPSGSTSSRSPSRSRSRSSSSSSSSSTSRDTSSSSEKRPVAIRVKNLPPRSSDTSLKDGLFHEYKKHGKVTWVKVVGQGSERYAIVCFKKPEDVEKALEVSYDKLFFGCKIEVEPYQGYDVEDNDLRPYEAEIDEFHPKATRTLFIGNLEKDVTASDLRKHFDPFGEIIEIDIKKQGAVGSYAFCQYSDIVSVVKAIRAMDGEHLGNNRIKLGFGKSMPTNCVWVDGVVDVNEKYLRIQFEPFGSISKVHVDRDKGQALIFYEQVVAAQLAVNKMRGFSVKGNKIQVDFASRECQESFFEHLEKQGTVLDRPGFEERRDSVTRTFDTNTNRFSSRYETPTRPRTSSYSSRSSVAASQVTSAIPSPGTPGSVTPRGSGSRSRLARFADYYDPAGEYATERHFRNYDEYSQGSAASHEDGYEHEYPYSSPSHVETLETRTIQTVVTDHAGVPFAQPDIRNLQKERVHLLEQLEECPSSGDELISPKKRLKLELLENSVTSDVIIEANRDHRKVMEVRRLSDPNLKHHSRRPSVDNKHGREIGHERGSYLPHAICKRRKTAGSDSGSRSHHYDHSGSESVGGSRPGTPLVDERPEHFTPSEPRRIPREREGPLTLPLPRFAAQVMNRGSVSVAGIKGQKDNILSSPPAAVTSPRISNPKPPSPVHVPPPASPPPRPPSLSSNSSDSDVTPPSPSLDERIRSLDEKYEKWSGSRALSAAGGEALAKLDATREKFRLRHKLLDLDLKEVQPSDIVKSVMAKRSVFDEDLKRLENVGEKYEPKEFSLFPRVAANVQISIPTLPLSAPPTLKVPPATQLPKTPTMLSPRSAGANVTPAKGLQYPFPSHPPVQLTPPVLHPQPPGTPTTPTPPSSTTTLPSAAASTTSTITRGANHGDNRLKPCASVSSDNRTSSKVNVNRSGIAPIKTSEKNSVNIPNASDATTTPATTPTSPAIGGATTNDKLVKAPVKPGEKTSDKVACRRDSNGSSPRGADIKIRRNSDTNTRRLEDTYSDSSGGEKQEAKIEEKKEHQRLEKARLENERLEKEKLEKERLEKEKQEKERLEKEKLERERLERESELEKERLEKERLEKERLERERRKEREERERREKEEKEKREREEREERERQEREKRERERQEREEKEKREEEERQERERQEKIEKERLERERKREEEKKHKDDNHDKRKEEHRHRENHSDSKHRDNNHLHDSKNTKDEKSRDVHETFRKDSHESSRSSHDKNRHHVERDADRRKESVKENRDNNVHEKQKNFSNEIRENKDRTVESRHMSIDFDRNKSYDSLSKVDPNKRKERNNSLPANIGIKRRLSSHESSESMEEAKKIKLNQDHKKLSERRDSKDSSRSEEKAKNKHKNNSKLYDEKVKHNNTKECDEKRKDREDRHKNKQKLEKHKTKSKSREKECRESPSTPKSPAKELSDKDFMARLDLRSNEEIEKQKQKEKKDKKKMDMDQDDKKDKEETKKSEKKDKHSSDKCKSREDATSKSNDDKKCQKKDRTRKLTQNSSDNNSDSDEPKKHSIFDIVDDEPAYISMYDKVKARSCKNMQKQEEEKRQEKIKAKFSQLKQSRAKREEKKRSTSWDEDSDSDRERHEKSDHKTKRGNKMLIMSSDEEEPTRKSHKKREIYTDSDSERPRQIKSEHAETSEDDRIRSKQRKGSKSRITSDTSDDEMKKIQNQIKSEIFSDNEIDQGFADSEDKPFVKVKDEISRIIKKSKHQDSLIDQMNAQIFGDSSSPLLDIKTERFNSRHSFGENSSAEENIENKKERPEIRKKHKKKQKRQKHSLSSEECSKVETEIDGILSECGEKVKHHDKKKQHSKKDKKRDKTKDDREKSKKSKKNKSEIKSDLKRDGKMENIFGSLSEDSESGLKESEQSDHKPNLFLERFNESNVQSSVYASDSDREQEKLFKNEDKERESKEEHRKRKEKKRREKERRLQEEAAASEHINENSMDYADMGKQLEANIKDDSMEEMIVKNDMDTSHDGAEESFRFSETSEFHESKKEDRKEPREKKKKRKKSKEEKQKHHHHHHHEKNKVKSEIKKEATPVEEVKVEVEETKTQSQSLPNLLDTPSPPQNKSSSSLDFSISPPVSRETLISPIPKTPTTSKEKKREKFIPGFGSEIDEKIHENAVKSISEFETPKEVVKTVEEPKPEPVPEPTEEKPRVVISQEETEDAVAALLGESFGSGQFEECQYEEDINTSNDQSANLNEDNLAQDDEEMRQAVQSLSANDLDVKPETPQSEHELQIDTDTEEQEENSVRFEQPPKTPEITEPLPQTPKTAELSNYYRNEEQQKVVLKPTANIGSPPSLTPIKPQPPPPPPPVTTTSNEVKRPEEPKTTPLSLPLLPEQPRSVISQAWNVEKKEVPKSEPVKITSTAQIITQTPPLRTYGSPAKVTEQTYPPLTALTKQEHPQISSEPMKIQQTFPVLQSTPKTLHNLPACSPVPQKPSPSPTTTQDSPVSLPSKVTTSTTNLSLSRLPITPIMASKPLQATTVLLPQAKIVEPPVLVSTSDPRPQERPRTVFQTSSNVAPPQFTNIVQGQPRMVVQTNVAMTRSLPSQGLLVPTRQLPPTTYSYLSSIPQTSYGVTPVINKEVVSPAEKSEPTKMTPLTCQNSVVKQTIIMSSHSHQPPTSSTINTSKSFMPVIKETPPKLVSLPEIRVSQPSIIHQAVKPAIQEPPPLPPKEAEKPEPPELLKVVPDITRTSTPSPVIVQTPPKEQVEKKFEPTPSPSPPKLEEPPKQLAIEKVTEELNLTLKKEVVEVKEEPQVKEEVKAEEPEPVAKLEPKLEVEESKPEIKQSQSDSGSTSGKEGDEEKADTESIVSDISKERSSADILASKDDPLDNKEDSDYWSAKEVNIDSVIKTLCSADELSDHSSETGKDEWMEECKGETEIKSEDSPKKEETDELNEQFDEPADTEEKEIATRVGGRRGGRARGRKTRGGVDRGGIQTRRGKVVKEPATPSKRGGRGGGRQKGERKLSKSESEISSADVYEFRDDSDESNANKERPRLILTIKSPAAVNTQAVVKEVVKEVPKEASPTQTKTPAEAKEEFLSPVANTRKSRRLQERDVLRNTVDDTIEDVVRNTVMVTRSATNQNARRSARQAVVNKVSPEVQRKSPRGGRKKDRRASDPSEDSSEEKPKPDSETKSESDITEMEKSKEVEKEETKPEIKEKPHEGLKVKMLRRVKGDMSQEPMTLIDPVTGLLTPMRECEEGRYIPLPKSNENQQKSVIAAPPQQSQQYQQLQPPQQNQQPQQPHPQPPPQQLQQLPQQLQPPQQNQQPQQQQQQPKSKPQSLKAHVLSSQAAKAVVSQQQQQQQVLQVKKTNIIVNQPVQQQPPVVSKSGTPLSQSLNVNVSMAANYTTAHLSPRPSVPVNVLSKALTGTKPPQMSPGQQMVSLSSQQKQQILQQVSKQQTQNVVSKSLMVSPMMSNQGQLINTQVAHMKQQPQTIKQPVISKAKPAHNIHPQQIMTGSVASPPLSKGPIPGLVAGASQNRIVQGPPHTPKGVMEPPKIDVSLSNVILGPRSNLSPQGQPRHVTQSGIPVPAYEASLHGERNLYNRSRSPPPAHQNSPSPQGEAIAHFPPGAVPLRPPHDLPPGHYMHPSHVMQYQFLRQPYHLPRSPMVSGGLEKSGDGQEGEEAPVTSPPLELRRPGSVGLALTGRTAVVPHSLHSPHDRTTDSPQVGQVYNMHTARMQHYHSTGRYYEQTAEPPPAHRPLTSHGSLTALPNDRSAISHMASLSAPERPLSGHMQPDRPLSSHSALTAHMGGLGTPERPLSTHLPDRPLSNHGLAMGAGLGAAGNLMGAVARHVGVDAPASQRGLQAATPPHASQVPPQAESLFMLLKQYPCMWQGLLALKNDQAAVQMYFVSGNDSVAKLSLPKNTDGSTPPLRIFQRMRLEPPQVEGVARKMQMENEHCMLLALPCGHDHMDVLKQSTNLTNGFITYLQQKQAAGIVNVAAPGTTQPPAYVVHIFPSCDFVNENLRRIAPSLLERVADIAHLLIVITTV